MKASLPLLAVLVSVSAAYAAPRAPIPGPGETAEQAQTKGCNVNIWPAFSPTPCRNVLHVKSHAECLTKGRDLGWTQNDLWWYCANLWLTN
jgi:hypothetical protein